MKRLFTFVAIFALMALMTVQAQDRKPDWARWHYLSEEEMNTPVRATSFTETPPPTGEPRFVAEFEPMQGVMIRYPLGIPTSLVAQLSNNCPVYCIVSNSYQNQAQNTFQNAGVNMSNVHFVNAASDSYWVRDYGPWYIFEDRNPAIVDNIYNRPRPNDDNMSGVFANYWGIPMYGMNLEHTGGNMMEDGRGHGVSDNLVLSENNNNETNVRNKMRDYLGIDPYHITIDPQGDYIAHVDCWGKYLAPDKILIAQLPSSNSHAADYDAVANYFATTNCCWGYPYRVYRVQEPGGSTLAPYTNSLILNKTVYVPLGTNNNYNQQALAVYQEAMPGYTIVGVTNNDWSTGWENTDALHCRTRGVMDFNMLFVDHRDVLHGMLEWQDSIAVTSKFIAYSGMDLKQDSLLVYYSINGGEYQVAHMTATGEPDEYVGYITGYNDAAEIDYFVFGADESGHRYTQPVFAELDPHHFTIQSPPGLQITPDTLWFNAMSETQSFNITNGTIGDVTIETIDPEAGSALNIWDPLLPYDLHAGESVTVTVTLQTPPTKDEYLAYPIEINTTAGNYTVIAMVMDEAYDMSLYIPGSPYIELTVDQPQAEPYVVNGNYGTHTPISITDVWESGSPDKEQYLILDYPTLPVSLAAGESFVFTVSPNTNANLSKEPIMTSVTIESSQTNLEFFVTIDENLFTSVTELTAETKLYPNPTTGQFTVEGVNVARVEVYNLVGQKVYEAQGKAVNIDATNWNKGIYLVSITDQQGAVATKKLVVK